MQQAHQSVFVCCVRPNMCALYVWCASVAKAALHHNTLRASSVRHRMFAKVFVWIIGSWTLGAIPDSPALLPLSHSPRQMFCCPSVSDRVKHGVVAPRARRPALIGLQGVRCGLFQAKIKTSRLHNDPPARALGKVLTHVSRFNPSIWTHEEMSKLITNENFATGD